jgi:hypothetical protein
MILVTFRYLKIKQRCYNIQRAYIYIYIYDIYFSVIFVVIG